MAEAAKTTILIGYGNPGRLDDGLGPAVAREVEGWEVPGLTTDADYQLTVEDSGAVAEHDYVIFVDASVSGDEPFSFTPVEPKAAVSFSSHSVEPQVVMAMAHDLFGASTKGFILGIRGYEFNEFGERLSPRARENMEAALRFLRPMLLDKKMLEAETWTS